MSLFDFGINILENSIIYIFLVNYLNTNSKFNKYVLVCFILLSATLMSFFNIMVGFEGIYIYIVHFISIIYCIRYSNNSVIECVFINFLVYSLIMIINGTLTLTINLVIFQDYSAILTDYKHFWIVIIISKLILFCVCYSIVKIRKSYDSVVIKSEISIMFLYIILISLIYQPFGMSLYRANFNINVFVVGFLSLAILSISFIFAFFTLLKINKKIRDSELKSLVQQIQLDKIAEIKELNTSIISLKHDMRHILSYISSCLDNNYIEGAQKSIDDYQLRIDDVSLLKLTSNDILNYTLNQLNAKCKYNGFDLVCSISSNCKFNLSDNDLLIILSNIFENAYENCCGENCIRVNIVDNENYSIISVENSLDKPSVDVYNDFKTSKKGSNHGYGINNVRDLLDKNGGSIYFDSVNYLFVTKIVLLK